MFTLPTGRSVLLSLALVTTHAIAQDPFGSANNDPFGGGGGFEIQANGRAVEDPFAGNAGEQASANEALSEALGGENGEIDFNRLRQLIDQSKARKAPTGPQLIMGVLREMRFDRGTAGILATRLEEAREKAEPAVEPIFGPETQQQFTERYRKSAVVFRRDVVLGRWDKVREFIAALPQEASAPFYQMLVEILSNHVEISPSYELRMQGAQRYQDQPYLAPADVLGLAAASPTPPEKEMVKNLAALLPKDPRPPQSFFDSLTKGVPHFGGQDPANRRRAAHFLIEAGLVKDAGPFLPDLKEAREKKDYPALNLIARHRAELAGKDKLAAGKNAIPEAWEICTSFLTDGDAPPEERAEALSRALPLISKLEGNIGDRWVDQTFKDPQGPGMELLATMGTLTAQNRENRDPSLRLEQLRLQYAAVKTIQNAKGIDPAKWSVVFTLFARQWQHEALVTQERDASNTRRMVQQFDEWGNPFYMRPQANYEGDGVQPINTGLLLECRPEEAWLASVDPAMRNECLLAESRLFLKVKEQEKVLPLIKSLAGADREEAKDLVRETIRVWTENHNPNSQQDYRSRYFYFYGFNNQSSSIPLTRSKQERNLVELADLVKGVRELDLGESFHEELATAFISCHSQAEVWRVEAVESVFGTTDSLDMGTLATLVARMRVNLAGLWPNPKLQQAYQTKRKDKEMAEQILRGYAEAQRVLVQAIEKHPAHKEAWRLVEQLGALRFEESNFRSALTPDVNHAKTKTESLEMLATAAKAYAATLPLEDSAKESSAVFETWFYGALGSPTLEALKSHHVATPAEYPKIKEALASLPEECRERHLKAFATTLNTRVANVAPDLKLRYLEAVTLIAGDHEALRDSKEVLAYYRDLVKEIELDVQVDGTADVGTEAPFGLRINLRHTREIEREAGGFQKYLQNQNNSMYGFNFGRPTEDYRDKFEKAARAALEEHFEVVSVTFHSDKVESRTDPEFGWRLTPYAYMLLKPKGPQIDKVPPLKIDLDFNDTSGYVVLPVTSGELPIDASKSAARPFRELKVTQTLDERSHAEKGALYLEVKASARGLVPSLTELSDLKVPGFETGKIEDRSLRVVELDAASDELAPVSEHEWRVELKPVGGALPASFEFPPVKPELAKEDGLVRQRYVDVDLVPVEAKVALTGGGQGSRPWLIVAVLAVIGFFAWLVIHSRRNKKVADEGPVLLPLPAHLSAISVIGYLKKLQTREGISAETKDSISREIAIMETRYFGREDVPQDPVALEEIARRWQAA